MPINGNRQKQRSCLYDLGWIRQQGEWLDALRQFAGREGERLDLTGMDSRMRAQMENGAAYVDVNNRKVEERQAAFIRLDTGIVATKEKTGDDNRYVIIKFHRNQDGRWTGLDFEYGDVAEKVDVQQRRDIRNFIVSRVRVGGNYRKFAFQNFIGALSEIGRMEDKKWIDVLLKNLWEDYEKQSPINGDMFVLRTGMSLRPDVLDESLSWKPISLMFKRMDSFLWDILVVIAGDEDNPIPIEKCVPSIYAKINRKKFQRVAIPQLAKLADKEDWSLKTDWPPKTDPYGGLEYYLKSVYEHLLQEKKAKEKKGEDQRVFVTPVADKDAIVFCTGLVTPISDGAHYIYAYCSNPDENGVCQQVEWLTRYDPRLSFEDDSKNHGLPYPPNWVSQPERLLFDYRHGSINENQIAFLYPHIFVNLRERLPKSVRDWFNDQFRSYEEDEDKFKKYLHGAWRKTRKILQKSFKVAIPTYYRGKIQLLVPLYLDGNNENEASVALVVALNENKEKKCWYFCPTCLSLDMARVDSRVITRIDDTWLKVDK